MKELTLNVSKVYHTESTESTEKRSIQRNRDTEKQRNGDTEPSLPISPVVVSLQGATGLEALFKYARALRAVEKQESRKIDEKELSECFGHWWRTASKTLPSDADYDCYEERFMSMFKYAKVALGASPINVAIESSKTTPMPPEADLFVGPRIKMLVSVCWHLQALTVDKPFWISVRDAAKAMNTKDLFLASAALKRMVRAGVLKVERPGSNFKATRYSYVTP